MIQGMLFSYLMPLFPHCTTEDIPALLPIVGKGPHEMVYVACWRIISTGKDAIFFFLVAYCPQDGPIFHFRS